MFNNGSCQSGIDAVSSDLKIPKEKIHGNKLELHPNKKMITNTYAGGAKCIGYPLYSNE